MNKIISSKFREAFFAVLPIFLIVLVLGLFFPFKSTYNFVSFLISAVFLWVGIAFYSIGCSLSVEDIGSKIASATVKSKKVWVVLLIAFIVGFAVTVAEPDLSVLAEQVPSINRWVLILAISFGVGFFVVIAVLRIILKISLNYVLILFYGVIFLLAFLIYKNNLNEFIPLSFDSGGVTTGPITVPFLMAFCVGISSVLGMKNSGENNFGMIGICSIGPIIAVLILGLLNNAQGGYEQTTVAEYISMSEVFLTYLKVLPKSLLEVAIALAPILILFIIFQIFKLKLPGKTFGKMLFGLLYTYIGLSIFLTGANVGFMDAGVFLGKTIAQSHKYLLVPLGAIIGACIIYAEPAVRELTKQVSEITDGMLKRNTLYLVLIISMAISLALAMLRIVCQISIWYIIAPMYILALVLTFFVPKIFTAIAFDSGGVASGPLTVAFLLPLGIGAAETLNVSVMSYAFGVVAFVAMTPLVALQILGIVYKIKTNLRTKEYQKTANDLLDKEGMLIDLNSLQVKPKTKPRTRKKVLDTSKKAIGEVKKAIKGVTKTISKTTKTVTQKAKTKTTKAKVTKTTNKSTKGGK